MSDEIISDIQIADNVFVRMFCMKKAGTTYGGHSHTFDHTSLLARGRLLMKHDKNGGGEKEFVAPCLIVVTKGVEHSFTALEDNTTFCCIHAIRDGDGVDDVADPTLSPEAHWDLLSKYSLTTKTDETQPE